MKKIKYRAEILKNGDMDATYVLFPFDTTETFGTKGRVKVKAKFDGILYRGSLAPMGLCNHVLILTKEIRAKTGKSAGDMIEVEIEQDTEERTVEIPSDFLKGLKKAGLKDFFEKMSYTHRKEYVKSVTDAVKSETRLRRISKALELISAFKNKRHG
ncbi:MAG: YdeI/OmpD-associated family protein [Bacteroidetes bacterium]|nr:YdeI/OmpD-associated family protein [Bacteroidota bacterium]